MRTALASGSMARTTTGCIIGGDRVLQAARESSARETAALRRCGTTNRASTPFSQGVRCKCTSRCQKMRAEVDSGCRQQTFSDGAPSSLMMNKVLPKDSKPIPFRAKVPTGFLMRPLLLFYFN